MSDKPFSDDASMKRPCRLLRSHGGNFGSTIISGTFEVDLTAVVELPACFPDSDLSRLRNAPQVLRNWSNRPFQAISIIRNMETIKEKTDFRQTERLHGPVQHQ